MLVALGFLCASLLALSALPALSRRADRLARRRAEAAFPLSLAEIAADRDHLRAELAIRERTLEQKAESGFAAKAGAMSEIGRRDMTIGRLETDLAERKRRIEALETELAERTRELKETRESLAAESAGHQTTQATLSSRVRRKTARTASRAPAIRRSPPSGSPFTSERMEASPALSMNATGERSRTTFGADPASAPDMRALKSGAERASRRVSSIRART